MEKEWKGNYNAVKAQHAIKPDCTTKGRHQDDFYATDPAALEKLLNNGSKWLTAQFACCTGIWECACGNGNLAECLKAYHFDVMATDLKNRGYGIPKIDFLKQKACGWSIILTNPPYSLANEFIMNALDILSHDGLYIALMNITYLAGQKRYENIYSTGQLREIYVFSKRTACWRNNDREKYSKTCMVDFAWYVFQKGYNGQPTLYWL